jgi:hypothetical protein
LKEEYLKFRANSINEYDFYNLVEKSVLEMEGDNSSSIGNDVSGEESCSHRISEEDYDYSH